MLSGTVLVDSKLLIVEFGGYRVTCTLSTAWRVGAPNPIVQGLTV